MKTIDAFLPGPLAYVARHLLIAVPLAAFIAAFFAVAFNDRYSTNFVYSLCIGLICQFVIDLGRRGAAWALRRGGREGGVFGRGSWPGWPVTLVIIAFGVWAGVVGGYTLAGALLGTDTPVPSLRNPRTLFVVVTVCVLASIGFTLVSWGRARLAATEAQAQRAQRSAAENRLKLLESQLEPHMLFNTLANLRVLIGSDPPRAQAMLDRLIAFLRATLQASRTESAHTLAAEFARVADYLALMQVRMGPRLAFGLDLPEDLHAVPVPPLLLQPLVENAIRHGLEPKVEGGRIAVAAQRQGDRLVLTVLDTGVGLDATATHGTRFGMQQVHERLAALHGAAASFALEPVPGGGTLARITLPAS